MVQPPLLTAVHIVAGGVDMNGFTLFTGGGGVDIAMESLGVTVIGGIECDEGDCDFSIKINETK